MAAHEALATTSRTDALLRITQAIETAATLDELLLLSLNELTRLFDASYGGVLLLREQGDIASVVGEFPPRVTNQTTLEVAASPELGQIFASRQPARLNHANDRSPLAAFLSSRAGVISLLVPLVAQDAVTGLLILQASEPERFNDDEIALARVLTGQLAAAIVAFQTKEAAQRRNEELMTLNEIAAAVTSTLDTHEVYRLVVQKLNEYFKVDAGSILLIDEPSGDLVFVMTIEGGEEKLAGKRVPRGHGVVGHVASTGKWTIVHDVRSDPRFYAKISEDLGYDTRSILCVPMLAKGRVIGTIELLNKLNGQFTEEDALRLTRMAAFIGVAIENAHLFQQVADGHDRLAAILDSTVDGILLTDMQGMVLSANRRAALLFELSESDLLGCSIDQLIEQLHQRAHEVITRSWNNTEGVSAGETFTEIELSDPRHMFIRHLTLPVRDANGDVYAQLTVLRDITQERELEQLREDYTGMMVHDLRAPLTSIMNGIMMVQRGLGGPVTDKQKELLSIAYQGSQTMLELVNNLLDISKMEQGRMSLDREPLVPYELVDLATERLSASARSQRVAIEQRLPVGLPLVEADKDKLIRVLQNLLNNAIKFSPSDASITLGAHHYVAGQGLPSETPFHRTPDQGEWLIFWVQDRGPGIPPAYHARIFEKFGQVRGRKVRGSGLGLTFCKLAVEAHGGLIWLESEEGAGSVFVFALPLAHEEQ